MLGIEPRLIGCKANASPNCFHLALKYHLFQAEKDAGESAPVGLSLFPGPPAKAYLVPFHVDKICGQIPLAPGYAYVLVPVPIYPRVMAYSLPCQVSPWPMLPFVNDQGRASDPW